ncbi:MAG TPA: TauD/TfdA family dioxygenase, partial [Candidatus Dormibacteraeota bacterium]|nr:TauD/TfdA family dioxygenase [Candidatus Dormibacteraeota bacterium]
MRVDQLTEHLPAEEIERPKAWTRDTISADRWLISLPEACIAELDQVVMSLRAAPRPVESLAPAAFSLRACSDLMSDVRAKLETDTGLAVVDRFPVERYETEENRAIGWLLAAMLGQVVAQKANGARLYDVKDTVQPLGYGVRRSVTNLGQPFHTDGGWLWKAPNFVGLFCLESALEGGLSRFTSLVTAHNELRRTRPDLLARLYTPFAWDRQGEHAPDDVRASHHPVFEFERGVLAARYY